MKFPIKIPFTIHITIKHIQKGEPRSCNRCATALSLSELLGDKYQVSVEHSGAWIYEKHEVYPLWIINFPEELADWIEQYDNGEILQPISTEITEERITFK